MKVNIPIKIPPFWYPQQKNLSLARHDHRIGQGGEGGNRDIWSGWWVGDSLGGWAPRSCQVVRATPHLWMFPKIGVPQNGWFITENPIRMDDLGVPLFLGTPFLAMKLGHLETCHTTRSLGDLRTKMLIDH